MIFILFQTQFENEKADLMRRLQADRKEEVKALAKKHRDRDELVRVKREVATAVVDRGVTERERLGQAYENKKDELQRQHEAVKNALSESKAKVYFYINSLVSHYLNTVSLKCIFVHSLNYIIVKFLV